MIWLTVDIEPFGIFAGEFSDNSDESKHEFYMFICAKEPTIGFTEEGLKGFMVEDPNFQHAPGITVVTDK